MRGRKTKAKRDRLSDLPDEILIHILSKLEDSKQVVRCSVLSTRWRFLWMSVPVSLHFDYTSLFTEKGSLCHWRSCKKIRSLGLFGLIYENSYAKDFNLWVHFATKDANVEDFTLEIVKSNDIESYEFPQFAYKCTWLKSLALRDCQLNPCGNVNWSSLVSLSLREMILLDGVLEKVLSGCPNLEHLELNAIRGIDRLEISSVKLQELILIDMWDGVEIFAPYIQTLQLSGFCLGTILRNVTSLVNAVLCLNFGLLYDGDKQKNKCRYMKELLKSVAHVENLELDPWCTECLSVLELEGWQSPPSSRKFLKLNAALQLLDFPGICSFLQSSLDLETLVIDWDDHYERIDLLSSYLNEDEQCRRFEPHNFDCSLLHLKAIIIIKDGPLSENNSVLQLVKYLLKKATVLEEFIIAARLCGSDVSQDYGKMEQKFLSFPRSSPHASIVFCYL